MRRAMETGKRQSETQTECVGDNVITAKLLPGLI